jgi:hypothetical protein
MPAGSFEGRFAYKHADRFAVSQNLQTLIFVIQISTLTYGVEYQVFLKPR